MTQPSPSTTAPDLCCLQAHDVVALLQAKKVSPAELLAASQSRTAATDPTINAMPTTCWSRAQAHAKIADPASLLAGVPLAIKDLNAVAGVRTTFGTAGLADFVPDASDPLVDKIEARGGVVVGKTNTPELGAGGNTFNDVFGRTLNPWNTALNAGGSSGGAAAGLAVGQVWLSHGSDHGGSLRTPAAFCGIVGLRPSPGRAGGGSADSLFLTQGVQGPMARSVLDCALFLDAMTGWDPANPISFPAEDQGYFSQVAQSDEVPRIGFSMTLDGFGAVDTDMAHHLTEAMAILARAGARVDEITVNTDGLEHAYHTLRGLMWVAGAKTLPPHVRGHFKPVLEENLAFGEGLTMHDVAQAEVARARLYRATIALFETVDVIALPVVGCMPKAAQIEWVQSVGDATFSGYMDWLRFAFLATVTGLPAMSVPVGLTAAGLPVGVQLIGPPRGEAALLKAAKFVEAAMGGPLPVIDPNPPKAGCQDAAG